MLLVARTRRRSSSPPRSRRSNDTCARPKRASLPRSERPAFPVCGWPPRGDRRSRLAELTSGRLVIERLRTREHGKPIDAPDGHHPSLAGGGVRARRNRGGGRGAASDYDRHAEIYQPAIAQSRILEHSGDTFRVFLRFFMKKVIAITVNSEHVARFTRVNAGRAYSQIVSTRVQEVRERRHTVGAGAAGGQ